MPNIQWEPGDDICPPWWPGWWRRYKNWPPPPPLGFEKYEQVQLTLTIHELASQLKDARLTKELQTLTGAALDKQVGALRG